MVPGRAKFRIHDSQDGTSRSRDRYNGRSVSPTRRRSSGSEQPRPTGVIREGVVYDPRADDDSSAVIVGSSDYETEPLIKPATPNGRRPHRLSSAYGSVDSPVRDSHSSSRVFLPLNIAASDNAERPLHRQESVLRLAGLIDDRAGIYEGYRMPDEELGTYKRKVRAFYEQQNETLDGFAEVDEILENTRVSTKTGDLAPVVPQDKPSAAREEAQHSRVQLAINVNFFVNFLLLAAKIAVVVLSNSVSLVASTVDSAMDFLSTFIIFFTNRVIHHRTWKSAYHFPTGRRRMEANSIVIFSVAMIASFLQVAIESIQRLVVHEGLTPAEIPLVGLLVMGVTIAIKLVLWLWCRTIKNSSVEALTQDAENDIVFNFFSILFPYAGQLLGWKLLDPLGGLALSIYIIVEWAGTLRENVLKLSGKRASPQQHQRIAYLLTRFSPLIVAIQHLSVYHAGEHVTVETDIVVPPNTSLTVAHNIGESVQVRRRTGWANFGRLNFWSAPVRNRTAGRY